MAGGKKLVYSNIRSYRKGNTDHTFAKKDNNGNLLMHTKLITDGRNTKVNCFMLTLKTNIKTSKKARKRMKETLFVKR